MYEHIGAIIRAKRIEKGLTQKQLARIVGISIASYQLIEWEIYPIKDDYLESVDNFFNGEILDSFMNEKYEEKKERIKSFKSDKDKIDYVHKKIKQGWKVLDIAKHLKSHPILIGYMAKRMNRSKLSIDLEKKRKELGLTFKQMAKLTGIGAPALNRYELGSTKPDKNGERILRKFLKS